jgi:hypothetical protein
LSKFHRSILSRTSDRQRFVTGRHPLTVTVSNDPTRKWLLKLPTSSSTSTSTNGRQAASSSSSSSSTFVFGGTTPASSAAPAIAPMRHAGTETSLLVNGTAPNRGLASLDRFQWLDDTERHELLTECSMVSVELLSVIHLERPGYLAVLPGRGAAGSSACALQQRHDTSPFHRFRNLHSKSQPITMQQPLAAAPAPGSTHSSDRLWVTGFSLAGRKGLIKSVEASSPSSISELLSPRAFLDGQDEGTASSDDPGRSVITSINSRTASTLVWPNEVAAVPQSLVNARQAQLLPLPERAMSSVVPNIASYQDALLVCDGFLVPGKDRGGVYIVKNPGNAQAEWTIRLTSASDAHSHRWFYHRATWVDLTGDGRLSVLTARCRLSTRLGNMEVTAGIKKTCQLVWLECPKPASVDPTTGTLLEGDGTVFDPFASRHLPWRERVLDEGPDVMFCVADMDQSDDTVEVISSQFFGKRVVLQSLRRGPSPEVVFRKVIDDSCGSAFGCALAELDGGASRLDAATRRAVVDSGSTVCTLKPGDAFSHLLVTSHERKYASAKEAPSNRAVMSNGAANGESGSDSDGGSLFAYRVPSGKGSWKTKPWHRSTIAAGFQVNGQLSNMINPGAPGFVYTFHPKLSDVGSTKRPLIAVAGDCAESAYIFRPSVDGSSVDPGIDEVGSDEAAKYKPMLEIKCESTVGSIAIGYEDFSPVAQESGYAKIFVPCFEKDKILVFALGSGEEEDDGW